MDLKREDLIQTCAACGGKGELSESSGGSLGRDAGLRMSFAGTCEACGGKGYTLTPAGKVLAQFIRDVR
jgi:DnaJ-class molecular chaperone